MPTLSLRLDDWPLIVVESQPGHARDDELLSLSAKVRAWAASRHGGFAVLYDLRALEGLTPEQRRALAGCFSHRDEVARRCVGQALVIESPVTRHMFTAVLWMSHAPHPMRVFSSSAEAHAWLRELLRAVGVTMAKNALHRPITLRPKRHVG